MFHHYASTDQVRFNISSNQIKHRAYQTALTMLRGHIEHPTDFRLTYLLNNFPCEKYEAVELGCWDGWHTTALAKHCKKVTAIDIRPHNISLTLLRLNMLGIKNVEVVLADAESFRLNSDILVHIGVLYHLPYPIKHLYDILNTCKIICLDTHIGDTLEGDHYQNHLPDSYEIYNGRLYKGKEWVEGSWEDATSGVTAKSLWPDLSCIEQVLIDSDFIISHKSLYDCSHGTRVTIIAVKQ